MFAWLVRWGSQWKRNRDCKALAALMADMEPVPFAMVLRKAVKRGKVRPETARELWAVYASERAESQEFLARTGYLVEP